jgi:hypothetical protein
MGAGRAAAFDVETTDFGSVRGRSSGPVEAAKSVHRLQQMTTNSENDCRIFILTPFRQLCAMRSNKPLDLDGAPPRGPQRLIYHGFRDLDRPSKVGQYAALSAEAAQLLDRRVLGNLPDFLEPTKRGCGKFGSAPR